MRRSTPRVSPRPRRWRRGWPPTAPRPSSRAPCAGRAGQAHPPSSAGGAPAPPPRPNPPPPEPPSPGPPRAERARWLRGILGSRWPLVAPSLVAWRITLVATLAAIAEPTVLVSHYVAVNAAG